MDKEIFDLLAEIRDLLKEFTDRFPQANGTEEVLMDSQEALQFLKISDRHLRRIVREKKLNSLKIGGRRLFRFSDLNAYVNKYSVSSI